MECAAPKRWSKFATMGPPMFLEPSFNNIWSGLRLFEVEENIKFLKTRWSNLKIIFC